MHWIPYGPHAVLVYFADAVGEAAFLRGRAVMAALERSPPAGLREFVPSFTSVLLEFLPGQCWRGEEIVARLESALAHPPPPAPVKVIPVIYDGPDLHRVAAQTGLSEADVIAVHAGREYRVYSLGFTPGFPYLGDLDPRLHVPRLPTPRPTVPAGAVAIGGSHTGIYPLTGPGGWNLIGRTAVKLFSPAAAAADRFFLQSGDRVRFEPEDVVP